MYSQGVFHYTRRLGYPVCYLRPVAEMEKKGHCHFAYPLYTTNRRERAEDGVTPSGDSASYDVYSTEKDFSLIDARTDDLNMKVANGSPEHRELVAFSEYFHVSLGKELAQDAAERGGVSTGAYQDGCRPSTHPEEDDSGDDYDEARSVASSTASADSGVDWNGVINSAGRQALGCMLGKDHMPTMCQSYPVAPELSQADFWHVRRVFWRDQLREVACSEGASGGRRLAPGWQKEEQYVVVHAPACEGFSAGGIAYDGDRRNLTPVRNGNYSSPNPSTRAAASEEEHMSKDNIEMLSSALPTMEKFIGNNLLERWEENQWFLALIEDISTYLPIEMLTNKAVTLVYVNRLAHIWYNFDGMQTAKSRPYKTYRRLKRDIETLTWSLVRETKTFVQNIDNISCTGSDIIDRIALESEEDAYRDLLIRLNIA